MESTPDSQQVAQLKEVVKASGDRIQELVREVEQCKIVIAQYKARLERVKEFVENA